MKVKTDVLEMKHLKNASKTKLNVFTNQLKMLSLAIMAITAWHGSHGVIFWGAGDASLSLLGQYPTCGGREGDLNSHSMYIHKHSLQQKWTLHVSTPGKHLSLQKKSFSYRNSVSTGETEKVMEFCASLVSQLGLLLWCASVAPASQGNWTQASETAPRVEGEWKVFTYFVVGVLCNGPVKNWWVVGVLGWLLVCLFFFHLAKPANLGVGEAFSSRIGFCLKNYQSMKQLLPSHSYCLSNLLCVRKHAYIPFLFLNCELWLWCAAHLHESDMRKETAGRQDPWRHEPYALIWVFFLFV